MKTATIPVEMRSFLQRYFVDVGAPVVKALDQKHVKGNKQEKKHVSFLLNKMG